MKKTKSKNKKSRLRMLAENKGVYIALFSLVAVVGFYVYARYLQTSAEKDLLSFDENAWQEAVAESGVEVIDVDVIDEKKNEPKTKKENTEEKELKQDQISTQQMQEDEAVETVAQPEREFAMIMPCQGQVMAECSVEELVYCTAMDDWRTHNGVDIAAAEGDPVKAAENGIVSKVYDDEFLGIVVVVDHEDGISSLYANLQSLDFISAGTKVSRGDIIGGVGKPGALEANSQPHLHFEVLANGEYKNPAEYIKY